jgi:hypothetical protein
MEAISVSRIEGHLGMLETVSVGEMTAPTSYSARKPLPIFFSALLDLAFPAQLATDYIRLASRPDGRSRHVSNDLSYTLNLLTFSFFDL